MALSCLAFEETIRSVHWISTRRFHDAGPLCKGYTAFCGEYFDFRGSRHMDTDYGARHRRQPDFSFFLSAKSYLLRQLMT